jgi:predicted TIM-barrel fold metal-dependent hydrolase
VSIPLIDIHQHLNFMNSPNDALIEHQNKMGVDLTILLPSSEDFSLDKGLLAEVPDTQRAYEFCEENENYLFAANFSPNNLHLIEKYINKGAKMIGEIKYNTSSDSDTIWGYCEVAQQFDVPILLHFENHKGISNLDNFEKTLKRFPDVNFIGHAVLWWAQVDNKTNYLMDKYDNLYADISANSGLRALKKPSSESFVVNYQDRILFGSDCPPNHPYGGSSSHCIGVESKKRLEQICDKSILEKIYYRNAKNLLKIDL